MTNRTTSSRIGLLAALTAGTLALAVGCTSGDGGDGGSTGNGDSGGDGGETYTVAQVRWEAGDIFFNGVAAGEEAAFSQIEADNGVTIDIKTVAANDAGEQVNGLQQLQTAGVDGVSLVSWRGESMVSIVEQLTNEGIPVVVHNVAVPGASAPFVAFDNVEAGRLAGEAMVAGIEEARGASWAADGGTILLLRGDITASFDMDRYEGYMSVLQPLADENPNLTIEVRADLGYQGEPARGAVADQITADGADNILGVGSVDGTMAVGGAIPALKTGGAVVGSGENAVAVTSIDCSQAELDSITAGELTHCSEQPALAEGELVAALLWDMMSNGTTTPSDGVESIDGWDGMPWAPVEVTTREDIEGPWYKTQAFAVPGDLDPAAPEHWAIASEASGE
ncbi:MAG: sugar ABC transporter substrate-binding protein [Beutenbergiaceae bacterium]